MKNLPFRSGYCVDLLQSSQRGVYFFRKDKSHHKLGCSNCASTLFDQTLLKFTSSSELISVDSVHSGMLTELTYTIGLKRFNLIQEFITELKKLNGNNKVTLIAGYNNTDL